MTMAEFGNCIASIAEKANENGCKLNFKDDVDGRFIIQVTKQNKACAFYAPIEQLGDTFNVVVKYGFEKCMMQLEEEAENGKH